jgi:hypothetical protein
MEIYTIRDSYDNIIKAFIVKELAEAYLAHTFDEHPSKYYYISTINTNDGEYAEESYVGRELHYGVTIFLNLNKDLEYVHANCRSSLKSISTYIDIDDICNEVGVHFEVDKETYETVLSEKWLSESKIGEELVNKAIDIYKKFKNDTNKED